LVLKACAITSGKIHPSVKNSTTPPLLKKPSLDNAEQSNYRPISNWSFYLKTTERAVKACLTDDLSRNNLLIMQTSLLAARSNVQTSLLAARSNAWVAKLSWLETAAYSRPVLSTGDLDQ